MKILYIHQYFRKPEEGGAIRSFYLAKSLVDSGVGVDLITTHNKAQVKKEVVEGINIHYLPIKYDNNFTFFSRIKAFISFMILSYKYSKSIKNIDLVYASSTPLTVGFTALLLKKWQKIPYYFEVRDLWPEAPIQMGVIKNSFLKFVLRKIEKIIYKNASKIITLSPGMKEGIVNAIGENNKTFILPNMSDCDFFNIEAKDIKNAFYFGTSDKFVVSYIGAIGKVNAIDSLIDVAEECQHQKLNNVVFLIAGKGSELSAIKKRAQHLKNVRFVGFLNREKIKKLLNVTDFSFISFKNRPILETNSPNKFFDSIASGKICIVNNKGWIKELIEEHKIGFYYSKNQPKVFIEKLKPYLNNVILTNEAKLNSRKLAENKFSKELITNNFISLFDLEKITSVAQKRKSKVARA